MVLDHLTTTKTQIGSLSGPDHLTTYFNAFLLSCRVDGLSPATLKNYHYQVGAFVRFCSRLGARAPNPVTTQDIRLFLLKLRETNRPVSVSDYYKTIKRFFNWLVDEGLIEKSPMQNIKPPRREERLVRPFSQQDIDNLLQLCSGNRFVDYRNKAIILMFLDTGLRLSELTNIQLGDIDFDRETIKVMGKGAKERVVRIGRTTQKALLRYLLMRQDNHACLWVTERRKPLSVNGVQIAIKKLCYRAEITDAKKGPHTFRHTFGTQALRNHADIREVQSLLGHSTLKTTLTYVQTVKSEDAVISHRKWSPVDNLFRK